MKTQEFIQAIECGKAEVLTTANVANVVGKTIDWMYFGYWANENVVTRSTIKAVVTEYDFYLDVPDNTGKYSSTAERWDYELSPERVRELKNTLMLIDATGKSTYIRHTAGYGNHFYCSDLDREVYYIIAE